MLSLRSRRFLSADFQGNCFWKTIVSKRKDLMLRQETNNSNARVQMAIFYRFVFVWMSVASGVVYASDLQ